MKIIYVTKMLKRIDNPDYLIKMIQAITKIDRNKGNEGRERF